MGFYLKVEGPSTIEFYEASLNSIDFLSNTTSPISDSELADMLFPSGITKSEASDARSADLAMGFRISGRIQSSLEAAVADGTVDLANWALVPSDAADCYRKVTVKLITAGQTVRQYVLPNAFVLSYQEKLTDESGAGEFVLVVRQKRDLNDKVELSGGFE